VQRGVAQPENVAAHSYGVSFTALLLAEIIAADLDRAAVLAMAILHDLPEGVTTDIPPAAWRYLPAGAKATAEQQAMQAILGDAPFGPRWLAWQEEYRRNGTAEAHLVHDADKLDQFLQAHLYELQTGNRQLAEFWAAPHAFHFPPAQAIYDELLRLRAENNSTRDEHG
jgi:putative hydrolase of HD superfamily